MKRSVSGKGAVLITGGASGIGLALAELYGSHGYPVAILDQDKGVRAIAGGLSSRGLSVTGYRCDIVSEKQVISTINRVIASLGELEIVFNNAGITQRSPFLNTKLSVYRRVMDVNFFGQLNVATAAMPSLIKTRGSLVITSSIAGIAPLVGRTGYAASKHALHGFFESLSAEMIPHGVHVMLVCPGFTRTGLQTRALGGDGQVTVHSQSKVGKESDPSKVAEKIYRAVIRKKKRIILSPIGIFSFFLNAFFPALYQKFMYHSLKSEIL